MPTVTVRALVAAASATTSTVAVASFTRVIADIGTVTTSRTVRSGRVTSARDPELSREFGSSVVI